MRATTRPGDSMKLILSLCAVFVFAFPCLAQSKGQGELFFGYSDSRGSGFMLAPAYNFNSNFALEADLSSHYRTPRDDRFHFDVGPRVRVHDRSDKAAAFGHLLFGASHRSVTGGGDTSFSWVLGGGAEYSFDPHWVGRLQIDLVRTHFFGNPQNSGRYTFGIAYRFGS